METLVKQTWHKIERTPRGVGVKPPNDGSPMSLKRIGQEGSKGFVGHVVKLRQTIVRAMVRKVQHPIMMQSCDIILHRVNTIGLLKQLYTNLSIIQQKQVEMVCSLGVTFSIAFTHNIVSKTQN